MPEAEEPPASIGHIDPHPDLHESGFGSAVLERPHADWRPDDLGIGRSVPASHFHSPQ